MIYQFQVNTTGLSLFKKKNNKDRYLNVFILNSFG